MEEGNFFTPVLDSFHRVGLCLGGVSLSIGSLCLEGSLSRGISVQGDLWGVSVQGGVCVHGRVCPVGLCLGGSLSRGGLSPGRSLSRGSKPRRGSPSGEPLSKEGLCPRGGGVCVRKVIRIIGLINAKRRAIVDFTFTEISFTVL